MEDGNFIDIKPTIFMIEVPEDFRERDWGTKIVAIWENSFIKNGYKGKFYLRAVQYGSEDFWSKVGYKFDGEVWSK